MNTTGKGYAKVQDKKLQDSGAPPSGGGADKQGVACAGLTVGCPRETYPGERRVAVAPAAVKLLSKEGFKVQVEAGAGAQANFTDAMLAAEGASIVDGKTAWAADIVIKVRSPDIGKEVPRLKAGATLVCFISPGQNPQLVEALQKAKVSVLAMDCIPRITRSQVFDALSSMANIAGYKAVIEAANLFGRFFTGQITAAGRVPPAKVMAQPSPMGTASSEHLPNMVRCWSSAAEWPASPPPSPPRTWARWCASSTRASR